MHASVRDDSHPATKGTVAAGAAPRGMAPGVLLAMLACLPIAGTLLVAQVLPQMEAAFGGTPGVRPLVAVALTIPALAIAICSWGMGWLADRVGKRRLLAVAMLLYAVFGLSPMLLGSLGGIIAMRGGMGVAEGVIMTCSTALIGDLYDDARRERLLSLQTACASVAAVVFAVVGGALGDISWRAPFAVYGLALLALPAMLFLVPADGRARAERRTIAMRSSMPIARLAAICAATLVLSLGFYVAQIQIPYLLNALGPVKPSSVGLRSAAAKVAVVVGTLLFAPLRRYPIGVIGTMCFAMVGLGLAMAGWATGYAVLATGLVIASLAGGIALPTFLNGAMALLPGERRAQGAGLWQSSFWAGQFLSPIMVIALTGFVGTLGLAVVFCGAGALVFGAAASIGIARHSRGG